MALIQNKTTRALIVIMCALVVTGLGISYIYYQKENKSYDPRVVGARQLYENFNRYAVSSEYDSVFYLMDTLEQIYNSFEHYKSSYEKGVLYNNRSAAYISMFMQDQKSNDSEKDSLLDKAEQAALKSISIYNSWFQNFEGKNEQEIKMLINMDFFLDFDFEKPDLKEIYLEKRVEDILEAQIENKRRLSVSYTNLGMVKRHQSQYDSAALYYKKAIDLWNRNLTAENNLNILLNKPLKKRNIIQKLFPPEK